MIADKLGYINIYIILRVGRPTPKANL